MKVISAGVVAASMPVRAWHELPGNSVVGSSTVSSLIQGDPVDMLSTSKFIINPDNRTIGFTEHGEEAGCTLRELYSYIRDGWSGSELIEHPFPMVAITPEYAHMENEWSMDWSRPEALRVGCIQELDGTKMASMIGLGIWEPDGMILTRDGRPQVETVNPRHHLVKLTPTTRRLEWTAVELDEEKVRLVRALHEEYSHPLVGDPATYDTRLLGFDNLYEQTQGSIRFPIPYLPARSSDIRAEVRQRITDHVMRRRTGEQGA